jgi:hypothetical protein
MSTPILLRAGEASKLFVTWRPSLFTVSGSQIITVSGSHLGKAGLGSSWHMIQIVHHPQAKFRNYGNHFTVTKS